MRSVRNRQNPNRLVIHFTIRTAYGLPFVPRDYMNQLLLGLMARGQELFPVQVIAFAWMGNHAHFILAGRGNLISSSTNYLGGEVAQMIKRFFPDDYPIGIWGSRPHEQTLCTPEDVVQKIAYLYANPARAFQADLIDDYQGFSSWKMFGSGTKRVEAPWYPRKILSPLPTHLTKKEERAFLKAWKKRSPSTEVQTEVENTDAVSAMCRPGDEARADRAVPKV